MASDPRPVTILLCTWNGARFLPAQLQSYLAQDHENWSLWVSDDGSSDGTIRLLEEFRIQHGDRHDIRLVQGPRRGSAANFLALLCHPALPPGLVALSDQDDIWLPGKLSRALTCLPADTQVPMLYSAQSFYIDAAGNRSKGSYPPPMGAPLFGSAMLQNVMAGHSMVLNAPALALVRRAGPQKVAFHDWWLTLLVTASGGQAVLDTQRELLYRQHQDNLLGAPGTLQGLVRRAQRVWNRDYAIWVETNVQALLNTTDLSPEAARALTQFAACPHRAGLARVRLLRRLGFHRQSRLGTLMCYLAALVGRL